MKNNSLEAEKNALHHMGERAFFPLENLDGISPIHNDIEALWASPLCWDGMPTMVDDGQAKQVIALLRDLYERALAPWEQLRNLPAPGRFRYALGMVRPVGSSIDRPALAFPAKIRREARQRFFQLQTTSLFSVEVEPNRQQLESINPPSGPLAFGHLAGMVAIVCVVRAVDALESILMDWAAVCGAEPGSRFLWLAHHDRERIGRILTNYMASTSGDQGYVGETLNQVSILVKSAEGWLALADHEVRSESKSAQAIQRVEDGAANRHSHTVALASEEMKRRVTATKAETLAQVAAAKSKAASKSSSGPHGTGKAITPQIVADYFNGSPGVKYEAAMASLSEKYKVSVRTVERRYSDAASKKLVSKRRSDGDEKQRL